MEGFLTFHSGKMLQYTIEVCSSYSCSRVNFLKKLPSFLAGGFLVAQFVRIDRDPSHWPFMSAIAFSASTFFMNDTKPYPLDFNVCGSLTTLQSLKFRRILIFVLCKNSRLKMEVTIDIDW